ncbi:WxL domain-containing protein, partial [Bacillus sp. D-CC]
KSDAAPLGFNVIDCSAVGASLPAFDFKAEFFNVNAAPTAEQSITLNPSGAASDLIDAKENQGMGTWVNTFGKDATEAKQSVELSVPGKTKKEQTQYTTSLTWELTDAPM